MNNKIQEVVLFNRETIVAGGSKITTIINMNDWNPSGYFSIQVEITGSGACKLEYVASNLTTSGGEPVTLLVPENTNAIKTGLSATSGPNGDGKVFIPTSAMSISLAKWLAFKVTETGGANSVTITATLCYQ